MGRTWQGLRTHAKPPALSHWSDDTALSLDPSAAPILRRATPEIDEKPMTRAQQIMVGIFVFLPMLALVAAIPFAWGWGLNWHDVVIAAVFYWVSGLGITVGYHRYFTHSSFKAKTGLRVAMAIAGSLAHGGPGRHLGRRPPAAPQVQRQGGRPALALAVRRRREGARQGPALGARHVAVRPEPDLAGEVRPRPARRQEDPPGRQLVPRHRRVHAPRLRRDRRLLDSTGVFSWHGAIEAFFWASLVRVTLLHHVTWSINSICHTWGNTDWQSRDRSVNVAWLAIASFGESWHNLHHADPTCARHGALKGQIDQSARVIQWFEKLGWAYDVRWPDEARLNAKRAGDATRSLGGMTKRNEKAAKAAGQADRAAA